MDEQDVLLNAIAEYGKEAQLWMVIEEMSELAKEICKAMRGKNDPDAIADEIADVRIMLDQAEIIFGVEELVQAHRARKLLRLKDRLYERSNT